MRTVKEWIGKTDDTPPSEACKRRILDRQGGKCAITGKPFTAKEKPQFDHVIALWLGGKNVESNLQAIHGEPHKKKTKAEASVRAKVNANFSSHLGLKEAPARPIQSRGFPPPQKAAKRADKLPVPPASQGPLYRRISNG